MDFSTLLVPLLLSFVAVFGLIRRVDRDEAQQVRRHIAREGLQRLRVPGRTGEQTAQDRLCKLLRHI